MLYLYCGSDETKVRDRARTVVGELMKRAPHAHVERVTSEHEDGFNVDTLLTSQGLFHANRIVILDHVWGVSSMRNAVTKRLDELTASQHVFIVIEGALTAAQQKALEKHAARTERHDATEEKDTGPSVFVLSDHLGRRNRKALWSTYRQLLGRGSRPEELHGILFWSAKNMMIARTAESAGTSGLKPFVYNKSKRASAAFGEEELAQLVSTLAILPHEAHRRGVELEYALERFILEN